MEICAGSILVTSLPWASRTTTSRRTSRVWLWKTTVGSDCWAKLDPISRVADRMAAALITLGRIFSIFRIHRHRANLEPKHEDRAKKGDRPFCPLACGCGELVRRSGAWG